MGGLIAWIIIGGIAGWLTSKIIGTDDEQSWVMNIVLGVIGGIVGGFVWQLISGDGFEMEFSIGSLLIAILGGLIFSYFVRFLKKAT
jgi:uncharacterized membrane protein YeaQ/YmgE (transglycosylase-associated protein family)